MAAMQIQPAPSIAFIGGGNMARALIAGLLRQGLSADQIRVGEPAAETRAALRRDLGVAADSDNAHAIGGAELIVLAVKPQQAQAVLRALRTPLSEHRPVLLSIAAGLRIADLARACAPEVAIVRAMPNRAALLGAAVTGLYAAANVTSAQRRLAQTVASAAGRAVWLRNEAELDIVTALSGSGPAYFFLLAEQMAAAAQTLGLTHETAQLLASETLHGAGLLARDGNSLADQRAAVTSKGGTTEAALQVLHEGGFDGLIARALQAAAARSAELAASLGSTLPTERP